MLIEPRPERLVAFTEITERTILSGRCLAGERFRITKRSDGRFGYCAWFGPYDPRGRREWIEVGSETTEAAAMATVEKIINERAQ